MHLSYHSSKIAEDEFVKCFITEPHDGQIKTIHYSNVIMGTVSSQNTSLTIVYSIVYSGEDQLIKSSPLQQILHLDQ